MTGEQFFDAFGQIDPAYVLELDELMARDSRKPVPFPWGRMIRAALIAALIAALMLVSAYASGLSGLVSRFIKDPGLPPSGDAASEEAAELMDRLYPIHHRDYISLSGIAGSPEYRAAAEWLSFKGAYADRKAAEQLAQGQAYYEWRDLERSFVLDAKDREICRLYQVWDEEMWKMLQEIAGKYGLSLHTERRPLLGDWLPTREHGQYEDGSFLVSVISSFDQQPYSYLLYLERDGALPCDDLAASCADAYEEWEYESARGDCVSIALRAAGGRDASDFLLFYDGGGVSITIKLGLAHFSLETMDEKRFIEHFIDAIDFSAVASAETPEAALAVLKGTEHETPEQ